MNARTPRRDDEVAPALEERFRCLVVPEISALLRVAKSLTRNSHEAEDLVQETLLKAYRAMDRFDGAHPRAWLFTILRNTHLNHVRHSGVVRVDEYDDTTTLVDSHERDPELFAERRAFYGAVHSSLAQLPESRRVVVELVDIDGLSYAEAGVALGVPIGTVMSRLHRARRTLRDDLRKAGLAPVKGPRP